MLLQKQNKLISLSSKEFSSTVVFDLHFVPRQGMDVTFEILGAQGIWA